jgi:hypothetical protein
MQGACGRGKPATTALESIVNEISALQPAHRCRTTGKAATARLCAHQSQQARLEGISLAQPQPRQANDFLDKLSMTWGRAVGDAPMGGARAPSP